MNSVVSKLGGSSTFWLGLVGTALHYFLNKNGIPIPWELVASGVGAYGVKEGLRQVGPKGGA